jgi:hypothetical protein
MLTTLFIAVISAVLGWQFALLRFSAEKWWERKMAAYLAIIESLHHVIEDMEDDLEDGYDGRIAAPVKSDYKQELEKKSRAAWAELRRLRDVGEFLLSAEAVAELRKMFEAATQMPPDAGYMESLDANFGAAKECLKNIIPIGHRDLSHTRILTRGKEILTRWWKRFSSPRPSKTA